MNKKNQGAKIIQIVSSALGILFVFLPYLSLQTVDWFEGSVVYRFRGSQLGTLLFRVTNPSGEMEAILVELLGEVGSLEQIRLICSLVTVFVVLSVLLDAIGILAALFSKSEKPFGYGIAQGILKTLLYLVWAAVISAIYEGLDDFVKLFGTLSSGIGIYLQILLGIALIVCTAVGLSRAKKAPALSGQDSGAFGTTGGKIRAVGGEYAGTEIPVGTELVIGRDAAVCQLILNGTNISRKHCRITYDSTSGTYEVEDFSTNGVFRKDGSRIPSGRKFSLRKGETIQIGNGENRFELL